MDIEKIARKIREKYFPELSACKIDKIDIDAARVAAYEVLKQLQLEMRKHWKACGDLRSYRTTATNSIITQALKELE